MVATSRSGRTASWVRTSGAEGGQDRDEKHRSEEAHLERGCAGMVGREEEGDHFLVAEVRLLKELIAIVVELDDVVHELELVKWPSQASVGSLEPGEIS